MTRQKIDRSSTDVVTDGRGKVVARCYDAGQGHAVCQRGRPR